MDTNTATAGSDTPVLDVLARTLHETQTAWAVAEPGIDEHALCPWQELTDGERTCYRRMAAEAVRAVWAISGAA